MIDVHSIISKHKTTTGAPVCLLSATPTNWPHRYPPRTPLPLPPTTRPPETNYAQYFFILMALLPSGRHSNGVLLCRPWAEFPSLSTKPRNKSFCVASPKILWTMMSGLLVVSLKWLYMDMLVVPIGGFFPLLHPEIYFVALDADEGNVFLTSQKYHTHDDMMGLIDSLKWYLMGSLLIRLGGFLFIVLQLNIVILVADLTKIWTILMCI